MSNLMKDSHHSVIGIVGNGFVGKATSLFAGDFVKVLTYDINPDLCIPNGTTLKDLTNECDIIFVCVPTPITQETGQCYLGMVESAIDSIKQLEYKGSIVLRSTVPPGTCYKLGVHHMPEFLRERTWQLDFRETKQWIIGVCQNTSLVNQNDIQIFGARIVKLLGHAVRDHQITGNEIYWATTDETELAKYTRNAFLATKLSFFNEIESFASASNIDYSIVRELVGIDDRIGMGHTQVPGADKQRGFGGTCFPKDIAALQTEMTKVNVQSPIIDAVIKRNNEIDRPDKKWEVGRTVV